MSLKQLIEAKIASLLNEDEARKNNNTFKYHAHVKLGKKPEVLGSATTKQKSSENADDNTDLDDKPELVHYRTSISAHRYLHMNGDIGGSHENADGHLQFDHDKKTIKLKDDHLKYDHKWLS